MSIVKTPISRLAVLAPHVSVQIFQALPIAKHNMIRAYRLVPPKTKESVLAMIVVPDKSSPKKIGAEMHLRRMPGQTCVISFIDSWFKDCSRDGHKTQPSTKPLLFLNSRSIEPSIIQLEPAFTAFHLLPDFFSVHPELPIRLPRRHLYRAPGQVVG